MKILFGDLWMETLEWVGLWCLCVCFKGQDDLCHVIYILWDVMKDTIPPNTGISTKEYQGHRVLPGVTLPGGTRHPGQDCGCNPTRVDILSLVAEREMVRLKLQKRSLGLSRLFSTPSELSSRPSLLEITPYTPTIFLYWISVFANHGPAAASDRSLVSEISASDRSFSSHPARQPARAELKTALKAPGSEPGFFLWRKTVNGRLSGKSLVDQTLCVC